MTEISDDEIQELYGLALDVLDVETEQDRYDVSTQIANLATNLKERDTRNWPTPTDN